MHNIDYANHTTAEACKELDHLTAGAKGPVSVPLWTLAVLGWAGHPSVDEILTYKGKRVIPGDD
jgi:hypothetical protein